MSSVFDVSIGFFDCIHASCRHVSVEELLSASLEWRPVMVLTRREPPPIPVKPSAWSRNARGKVNRGVSGPGPVGGSETQSLLVHPQLAMRIKR